jgi:ATP/maltotriose-dependent transcriptional regulator MalT
MTYPTMTGPFIGRTADLALLGGLLTRAVGGDPVLAVVGGEAGVGKTRLVGQLAATASEQGVRVRRGGCVQLGEEGLPFAPVVEALRGLAGELDPSELVRVAGPAGQELGRLLHDPAWTGGRGQGDSVHGYGPGGLFELLLGVVERLSANAPLLLVIEDLHWADRSTRDLVAFLATYLRSGRVMVALTFRSDELHRLHPLRGLLAELARNRRVSRLELARFTRAELAEQLTVLVGTDPSARLLEDIYARSGGNPFFAEELVMAAGRAGGDLLPPSLHNVLLTRVVHLGRGTQQVLRVAAVAGPGVTQPVLAAAAGLGEAELIDSLREAVDHQVLVPEPAGDGYAFRHALVAEAVYGELLPGERVALHTALAGILTADTGYTGPSAARAAHLAHHWAAAGDQPRALTASIDAAAAAEQVYAFAEAALQLERVLAMWDQVPDAEEWAGGDRVMVLSRCANAASWAGDTARAAQLARRAVALADQAGQPRRSGLLHEQLAACLRDLGDPSALAEQQEAVRLVAPEPSPERARVLLSLAWHLVMTARFAEARALAEEAAGIAAQVGAGMQEADARCALGQALAHLGEADAGIAELDTAGQLAVEAGDVPAMLRATVNHSDVLLAAGRLEEAVRAALGGIQYAGRIGLARYFGQILAAHATEALVAAGRWDEAGQVSRDGLNAPTAPEQAARMPLARAALELGRGDLDAAEAHLRIARRLLPVNHAGQGTGPLFAGLAELALWRGNLERARELVAEAVPLVAANPRHAAPLYALGVRIEADRTELARARRPGETAIDDSAAAPLLEAARQAACGPAAAGLPELAAWHATALAEATRHVGPADPAAWAAAATVWQRLGQPYRAAYARYRQAEALMARDSDRDAAAAVLRSAAAVTGRLGARLLDAEVKALARRARLDLAQHTGAKAADTPAGNLGLTPREAEVLALVAGGCSNRQIAQLLFISPKTASVHVSNILAKLGVSGRLEAAAVAHRLGLDTAQRMPEAAPHAQAE